MEMETLQRGIIAKDAIPKTYINKDIEGIESACKKSSIIKIHSTDNKNYSPSCRIESSN